jgi:hypothetical protein
LYVPLGISDPEYTPKLKFGILEMPPVTAGDTAISVSFPATAEPKLSNNG